MSSVDAKPGQKRIADTDGGILEHNIPHKLVIYCNMLLYLIVW